MVISLKSIFGNRCLITLPFYVLQSYQSIFYGRPTQCLQMLLSTYEEAEDIVRMQETSKYGDALLYQMSEDLQRSFPDMRGFSFRNLYYMKTMYLTFNQEDIILPQLVAKSQKQILPQPVADFGRGTNITPLDYVSLVPWVAYPI